jgi:hypothetical protein
MTARGRGRGAGDAEEAALQVAVVEGEDSEDCHPAQPIERGLVRQSCRSPIMQQPAIVPRARRPPRGRRLRSSAVVQLAWLRRSVVLLTLAALLLLSSCVVGGRTNWLADERWDYNARPRGQLVLIGDSVGWGLTTQGLATLRLSQDGWGAIRSYTQLGLHSAPEGPRDIDTVVHWSGRCGAWGSRRRSP